MTQLNQQQLEDLCRKVGFNPINQAIGGAVALCEAPVFGVTPPVANTELVGDQDLADSTWGYSYGVFQIRSLRAHKGTGKTRDEERLMDPLFNARSARTIKLDRGSWKPWSTFQTGQYKAYLQDLFPPAPGTYPVVAGDTLSIIAAKLPGDWNWEDLARFNGIHSPYTIRIGDILQLPS